MMMTDYYFFLLYRKLIRYVTKKGGIIEGQGSMMFVEAAVPAGGLCRSRRSMLVVSESEVSENGSWFMGLF